MKWQQNASIPSKFFNKLKYYVKNTCHTFTEMQLNNIKKLQCNTQIHNKLTLFCIWYLQFMNTLSHTHHFPNLVRLYFLLAPQWQSYHLIKKLVIQQLTYWLKLPMQNKAAVKPNTRYLMVQINVTTYFNILTCISKDFIWRLRISK